MATSYASTVVNAPADAVRARIRGFNGLATRHAGLVASSEIEEGRWPTFDCDRDDQAHWTAFFASQVFPGGFDALEARVAS